MLALLAYSLERTAWLFGLYEQQHEVAIAAAVVVEFAAVALIAGAAPLAKLSPEARAWSNRALLAVLSVQSLANLAAGFLRGGRATLALFGSPNELAAYVVAATLWLVTNLAIPALVLCLSKLLEHLLAALVAQPIGSQPEKPKSTGKRWRWPWGNRQTNTWSGRLGPMPEYQPVQPEASNAQPVQQGFNSSQPEKPVLYTCKKCGGGGFTFGELGRHSRVCQTLAPQLAE